MHMLKMLFWCKSTLINSKGHLILKTFCLYDINNNVSPFPYADALRLVCNIRHLKTLWQREKLLMIKFKLSSVKIFFIFIKCFQSRFLLIVICQRFLKKYLLMYLLSFYLVTVKIRNGFQLNLMKPAFYSNSRSRNRINCRLTLSNMQTKFYASLAIAF